MMTEPIPQEEKSTMSNGTKTEFKTVAVLGGAYGGHSAAKYLSERLPKGWRVVVVERNTHFNHVYVHPRFSVLTGHAHKGFIPYSHILGAGMGERHLVLNAHVTKLGPHSVTLSKAFPEHGIEGEEPTLYFDYAVYALGSHMPAPIDLWGPTIGDVNASEHCSPKVTGVDKPLDASSPQHPEPGSKSAGIQWLGHSQEHVRAAPSVLVVGGGALGIQYATDIADIYPDKTVILIHSRYRLLPRFDECMHTEIVEALSALNVNTILGDRLDLSQPDKTERNKDGVVEHVVRTLKGREIRASIILLCTGQQPNTDLMRSLVPSAIVPDGPSKGMIRVNRLMQVGVPATSQPDHLTDSLSELSLDSDNVHSSDVPMNVPYPHLFAVGDAADTFGAINAGHTAYAQAQVASKNILKLIHAQENPEAPRPDPDEYHPGPPGIKMSIGRNTMLYQSGGQVGRKGECPDDLHVDLMWKFLFGREVAEEEMYE